MNQKERETRNKVTRILNNADVLNIISEEGAATKDLPAGLYVTVIVRSVKAAA